MTLFHFTVNFERDNMVTPHRINFDDPIASNLCSRCLKGLFFV